MDAIIEEENTFGTTFTINLVGHALDGDDADLSTKVLCQDADLNLATPCLRLHDPLTVLEFGTTKDHCRVGVITLYSVNDHFSYGFWFVNNLVDEIVHSVEQAMVVTDNNPPNHDASIGIWQLRGHALNSLHDCIACQVLRVLFDFLLWLRILLLHFLLSQSKFGSNGFRLVCFNDDCISVMNSCLRY